MERTKLKSEAIRLRREGHSYGIISHRTGVAKSTLSYWLCNIPYSQNKRVEERIARARIKSIDHRRQARLKRIEKIRKEAEQQLGEISKRDLFLLGLGLYLGDGSKRTGDTEISNSNPKIMIVAITWFREICKLETKNFTPVIYAYPDSDIDSIMKFWSSLLKIPKNQFGKTQIDTRTNKSLSRKGRLPYGTLHLRVRARGDKRLGVNLHRRIIGWIDCCIEKVDSNFMRV